MLGLLPYVVMDKIVEREVDPAHGVFCRLWGDGFDGGAGVLSQFDIAQDRWVQITRAMRGKYLDQMNDNIKSSRLADENLRAMAEQASLATGLTRERVYDIISQCTGNYIAPVPRLEKMGLRPATAPRWVYWLLGISLAVLHLLAALGVVLIWLVIRAL